MPHVEAMARVFRPAAALLGSPPLRHKFAVVGLVLPRGFVTNAYVDPHQGADQGGKTVTGSASSCECSPTGKERTVDLERIHLEAPQVGEGGIAGAEVVDRLLNAEHPQRVRVSLVAWPRPSRTSVSSSHSVPGSSPASVRVLKCWRQARQA
jgi:hypothetical protein